MAGTAHRVVDGGTIARTAGCSGFGLGQFKLGDRLDANIGFVGALGCVGCRVEGSVGERVDDGDQNNRYANRFPHYALGRILFSHAEDPSALDIKPRL
ncbi:hypothetical protein SDC9_199876 [bioreactor metagenome]|uniref:Uncharacterized protein n=1 Tax=bioreactor metagenome TaxID=1076179 RepID=A0A645IMA4_9ZZZZ